MDACECNLPSAPNILHVESKRRKLKSDPI